MNPYYYYDIVEVQNKKLFLAQSPNEREEFNRFLSIHQIDYVVNLLPETDNRRLGYEGDFYSAAKEAIFFPITDYGIPRDDAAFHELIARLRELIAVHNVLIHCRAGCGRTGLVATALLIQIEPEVPVNVQIRSLRDIRPCIIDTSAQIEYLKRFQERVKRLNGN